MPFHLHSPTGHCRLLSTAMPLVALHGHAWLTEVVSNVSAGAVRRLGRQAGGGGCQRKRLLAQLWRRSVAGGPGDSAAACLQVIHHVNYALCSSSLAAGKSAHWVAGDITHSVCALQAVHRTSGGCRFAASNLQTVRHFALQASYLTTSLAMSNKHYVAYMPGAGSRGSRLHRKYATPSTPGASVSDFSTMVGLQSLAVEVDCIPTDGVCGIC